ncbi:2-succinyl-5-enolpyruvyl-6-hydroxy-3-cyclohexene-1-carboxylic-acid synthase [Blattabacterium cuenoti]|uniref:2-succinyl-5-enolpyruvyl-6-hydroxy-3- cyclohexene-1-carboxylic-acid synthase n=1 Tax=Blattabacterium cuenoti TaxID=1653831 RepID=UPI00163D34B0|nr:2-succinyl-5-enolpyruvyl-6-hydroxy-3-cyclohexene-1-carboxylic-acid synthase [Blattabacterium cuenoti]
MYSDKKIVQILGEVLKLKSIFNIIISPGSRNAPIIIHFTKNKLFKTYSIVDERCAGFFALGMAQQLKKPVIINCTSGSSVVNYYPAVIESFYQNIPIIIITADRPKEFRTIYDGQSMDQENIFKKYVEKFVQLTEDESKKGIWYNNKLINESINQCILTNKPVHINIPFSEPLYGITNKIKVHTNTIKTFYTETYIKTKNQFFVEKKIWNKCKKKMILLGLNNFFNKTEISKILMKISLDRSIIIFSETTSKIYGDKFFSNIDQIIYGINSNKWNKTFKPNILLTIGTNVLSKKIKNLLRKSPPKYHWHIGDNCKDYPDTYFKLNTYWNINPEYFFKIILENKNFINSNYQKNWKILINKIMKKQNSFLKKEKNFSDLKALFFIFSKIPIKSVLQLGNSMIIRYYQLFNNKRRIDSYCNRGISGIDGSVSTAVGHSLASKKIVTLIIGDISFFYDSNALWNNYTPKNFRIILINNKCGNIFSIISNEKFEKEVFNFFETKHDLCADKLCEMYKWNYEKVSNLYRLKYILSFFWKKSSHPFLLEVNTKNCKNAEIFKKFLYSSK